MAAGVTLLLSSGLDHQADRAAAALVRPATDGTGPAVSVHRLGPSPLGVLRGHRALRHGPGFDDAAAVHAFGVPALTAAALSSTGPLLFSPVTFPTERQVGWLRAVGAYRAVHTIVPTATMRAAVLRRGVPPDRVHLIRPGVDFARVRRRRDDARRAGLGLADGDIAVLAVGETTRAAGHDLAVWAVSMLRVLDRRYRLVLWGRGEPSAVRKARALGNRIGTDPVAVSATERLGAGVAFDDLLAVADVLLVTATGPVATLPVAVAMAAGLPIVATVTPTVAELLEDRHNCLMVRDPLPRSIARRVLEARGDPGLQWRISDAARTDAYEYFGQTRFVHQHRAAYRQLLTGQPVEVPEPAPGAGARFRG